LPHSRFGGFQTMANKAIQRTGRAGR
jgi:hypothetical protein